MTYLLSLIILALNTWGYSPSDERLKDDAISWEQYEWLQIIDGPAALDMALQAGQKIPPFQESQVSVFESLELLGPDWQWYPKAYGYQRLQGQSLISWGMFPIEGFDIFTLKIAPLTPSKKLVVFNHGYLDHSGNYTNFYEELVRQGVTVVVFDMPGHGLSSGERASINNFTLYAKILVEITRKFSGQYEDVTLVGFSTGGSAILEARRLGLISPKQKTVLIAPLFRIKHYWIAEPAFLQALHWKYDWGWDFLDSVLSPKRRDTQITHDELFDQAHDADPLAPQIIPEAWTRSYIDYADRLEAWALNLTDDQKNEFGRLLMLQGDDDRVVDATQGVGLVLDTFPQAQVEWIEGGRHCLLNEGVYYDQDLLPEIYKHISDFILTDSD